MTIGRGSIGVSVFDLLYIVMGAVTVMVFFFYQHLWGLFPATDCKNECYRPLASLVLMDRHEASHYPLALIMPRKFDVLSAHSRNEVRHLDNCIGVIRPY